MRRGFTLVEVMMASGIIGLGVLGLIALMAGAARVQQTSSQTSQSVLVAKNAGALVTQALSSIEISPAAPLTQTVLIPNQWYMVPESADLALDFLEINDPSNFVWPMARSTEPVPYFLFDGGAPGDPPTVRIPGSGDYGTDFINPNFPADALKTFFHGRIRPESLVIRVKIIDEPVATNNYAETGVEYLEYRRPLLTREWPATPENMPVAEEPAIDTDPVFAGSYGLGQPRLRFYRDGDPTLGFEWPANIASTDVLRDYIDVDLQSFLLDTRDPAEIVDYQIAPVTNSLPPLDTNPMNNKIVDEIFIDTDYSYLNRQLVSLSDRIKYAEDDSRASGRRPEFAYSLFYRTLSAGGSQAGIFVYALQAPSGSAEWNPVEDPDGINDEESPVAEVGTNAPTPDPVTLGFDSEPISSDGSGPPRNQHYIEVPLDADLDWVVAPGQVLMVSWEPALERGADNPVTVTERVVTDTAVRGYLDRGPRGGGISLLAADLTMPETLLDTKDVRVFAVRDVALSDDGSRWRLRPLRFVVFQLPG